MMVENVEELTVNYEMDGKLLVKELKKEILTRGSWATIMFLCQKLNKRTGEYGDPLIAIKRYRKVEGFYKLRSTFNISSEEQAHSIVNVINKWVSLYF